MSEADDPKLVKHARDILNGSGFPFQLRVETEVHDSFGWRTSAREYPWHDARAGREEFVDLVLQRDTDTLVIESKRIRDASPWVFLVEGPGQYSDRRLLCYYAGCENRVAQHMQWFETNLTPGSPSAGFCARHGAGPDAHTLERLAGVVVRSVERVAEDRVRMAEQNGENFAGAFVGMIVTTARLLIYDPYKSPAALDTGQIEEIQCREVPMVRFRKAFSAPPSGRAQGATLADVVRGLERTVLIVNAKGVADVLRQWELGR